MSHEHRQPSGGRLDFLMLDRDAETFYEVEIMLGTLDESHIIRTIEYWDIESQRHPAYEHRAVIVAEEITSRFFNVLRLFNRAVPMIAVQLSAFRFDESIVLHTVTVLDVAEESGDIDDQMEEPADRAYWEKRSSPDAMAMVDKIIGLALADVADRRVPRQKHCRVELRISVETRDKVLDSLQGGGIDASRRRTDRVTFPLALKSIEEQQSRIHDALKQAEEASRV